MIQLNEHRYRRMDVSDLWNKHRIVELRDESVTDQVFKAMPMCSFEQVCRYLSVLPRFDATQVVINNR